MEKVYNQSFENHARFVPGFHYVLSSIILVNLGIAVYLAVTEWSAATLGILLTGIALVFLFLFPRFFALSVQDRVIRLEETLRMERLLPADLKPRIGEFSIDQLVALRFASDEELPVLARKVLDDRIGDRKTIKRMIRNWKPDFLRA